ncbi:MAG TPA: DUF1203 domain-containing protein [Albidovulum sp.]|uniref:DUF1203 domain-containing protein n=1 Tax=Albidovulum sp. TaxID=1872424 RepID=UPI002B85462B|nr:DUF1203 domain-containing protein [Albidovulum sp.]
MDLTYEPIPTELARALRAGAPDANGQPPERGAVADGKGEPCRHCLKNVEAGREYLILAHRPFPAPQPYAETGPIFLCADDCAPWSGDGVPPILGTSPDYLLKGYTHGHRIRYGTGHIVPKGEIEDCARGLLEDPAIAFVDVRSARNNCFQLRIRRASVTIRD